MKRSLLAMALAACVATSAMASEKQMPGANDAFTQADIQTLFGQDEKKTSQPISLSAQEMQDTEGAWIGAGVHVGIGGGYYGPRRPHWRGPYWNCYRGRCW